DRHLFRECRRQGLGCGLPLAQRVRPHPRLRADRAIQSDSALPRARPIPGGRARGAEPQPHHPRLHPARVRRSTPRLLQGDGAVDPRGASEISRGHHRRAGAGAGRADRPAAGQEFRQAGGESGGLKAAPHAGDRMRRDSGLGLMSCDLAVFAVGENSSAIMAALANMATELGLGAAEVEWAVNAYLLASAAFIILGGRVADGVGARRSAAAGILLFALASLIIALAPDGAV